MRRLLTITICQILTMLPLNLLASDVNKTTLWQAYVEEFQKAGELVREKAGTDDEQILAELYRQLIMNISVGYFVYLQADPLHPDWIPFFNSVYLLQPNPDTVYHLARIDDRGIYRITGNRGGVLILNMATGPTMIGISAEEASGGPLFDFDELDIDSRGDFSVVLSTSRPEGYKDDWWQLAPGTTYLLTRQVSYDWSNEQSAKFAIERTDKYSVKHRLSAQEVDSAIREIISGFAPRLSNWGINHVQNIRNNGLINKVAVHRINPGEMQDQMFWEGNFDIAADEALIIEVKIPESCRYWNVQLNDTLFNAIEFIYRQSSLNGFQAHLDGDGVFRAVVALNDPGVPNWLDAGDHLRGNIVGRWNQCSSNPTPTVRKVKSADVRESFPQDTPVISAAEREQVIRERIRGGQLRRRW